MYLIKGIRMLCKSKKVLELVRKGKNQLAWPRSFIQLCEKCRGTMLAVGQRNTVQQSERQ